MQMLQNLTQLLKIVCQIGVLLQAYERANLADALLPRTLIDGELIIRQGDTADGMYFVEDGSVSIRITRDDGNEHEIKRLGM